MATLDVSVPYSGNVTQFGGIEGVNSVRFDDIFGGVLCVSKESTILVVLNLKFERINRNLSSCPKNFQTVDMNQSLEYSVHLTLFWSFASLMDLICTYRTQ